MPKKKKSSGGFGKKLSLELTITDSPFKSQNYNTLNIKKTTKQTNKQKRKQKKTKQMKTKQNKQTNKQTKQKNPFTTLSGFYVSIFIYVVFVFVFVFCFSRKHNVVETLCLVRVCLNKHITVICQAHLLNCL